MCIESYPFKMRITNISNGQTIMHSLALILHNDTFFSVIIDVVNNVAHVSFMFLRPAMARHVKSDNSSQMSVIFDNKKTCYVVAKHRGA